ncbi:hypothetical protein [Thiovibrio frasassiensis]|jgi:nickel transport protein|uniref:ABC transporter permease n=1 Tax=Thiovibrio frasassiensis TaxID=2984131 RepID=A0A9X4MR16_9BACT|nr:hypothetical protein [Thiovibrio frasassiensis]MDG4477077.1 hypothetical protein [Thiovibrio frasassiensis]
MRFACALFVLFFFSAPAPPAHAHAVHYRVENRGISARLFYGVDDPVSYAAYEIFGPGDAIPHQKGRTDRNGIVSFLPDRPGAWRISVVGEAEHGAHGAAVTVRVAESLYMASFDKPLVAQYTKGFVGMSILLFAFSLWVLLGKRKEKRGGA